MNVFVTALVGQPFGLEGYVRIKSLSGETDHLLSLKKVNGRLDTKEIVLEIENITQNGGGILAKFRGIDSPEAVRQFSNMEIIVERNVAAPLGKGEFYIEDLKNLQLMSPEGNLVGTTVDVVEGGGGFLVEARLDGGEFRFIPFRKEFIGDISPEKGTAMLLNTWILA